MRNTVEKTKTTSPKRDSLARIVRVGIRNFERSHPGYVVSQAARSLVVKHALKHQDQVLSAFRARTLTRGQFLQGLKRTLEAAQGEVARTRYKKSYHGYTAWTFANKESERHYATVERLPASEISALAVQKAINKTCKTFPWC